MGTRASYGFRKNNKDILAYRHYDGDYDCAGKEMIEFIQNSRSIEKLHEIHDRLIPYDETIALKELPSELLDSNKEIIKDIALKEELYTVFRWNQDLNFYLEYPTATLFPLHNEFIRNSLNCEYAYIINLDTLVLEIYRGFQHVPQKGNRYGEEANRYGYYPCAMVGQYDLEDIINKVINIETIITELDEEDEDE